MCFILFLGGFEDIHKVIAQIKVACEGISCFYITGHGVDTSLMADLMKCGKDFFNLPMDKKLNISLQKSPVYRGYIQQGTSIVQEIKNAPSALFSYIIEHAGVFKNTREVLDKHEPQASASRTSRAFLNYSKITEQFTRNKFFIYFIKCIVN